jgi:para-aminobenzoate synthetase/4-amino-4-deoxychorismate lyase
MEIIAELEPESRGVYCGAIGYIGARTGHARFAVGIRTACTELSTGHTVFGSGGAITWDSAPSQEWDEVLAKCSVLTPPPSIPELLETFRFDQVLGPVNFELHLGRMLSSANYFGVLFDTSEAQRLVEEACSSVVSSQRVRLLLDPVGRIRVELDELSPPTGRPIRLGYADQLVDSGDVRLFHKISARDRFDQARLRRPDVDDVVLLNERLEVTQTTIANIAVHLQDRWWTPPVECGLLPGVERARLVALGSVGERIVTTAMFSDADDLMVLSSLRGARPAVLVDPIWAGG